MLVDIIALFQLIMHHQDLKDSTLENSSSMLGKILPQAIQIMCKMIQTTITEFKLLQKLKHSIRVIKT